MASVYPKTKIGARANASKARTSSSPATLGERGKTPGANRVRSYTPGPGDPALKGGMGAENAKQAASYTKSRKNATQRKLRSNLKASAPSGVTKAATNLSRASRAGNVLGTGMMAFQAGRDIHNYIDRKSQREEFKKGTKSPVKSKVAQGTAKRLGI